MKRAVNLCKRDLPCRKRDLERKKRDLQKTAVEAALVLFLHLRLTANEKYHIFL